MNFSEKMTLAVVTIRDEVDTSFTDLVVMTRPLAVLRQAGQGLVDEADIIFVDVQTQKSKTARCAATDTIEELQCLPHQVVCRLTVHLVSQVILNYKKY